MSVQMMIGAVYFIAPVDKSPLLSLFDAFMKPNDIIQLSRDLCASVCTLALLQVLKVFTNSSNISIKFSNPVSTLSSGPCPSTNFA